MTIHELNIGLYRYPCAPMASISIKLKMIQRIVTIGIYLLASARCFPSTGRCDCLPPNTSPISTRLDEFPFGAYSGETLNVVGQYRVYRRNYACFDTNCTAIAQPSSLCVSQDSDNNTVITFSSRNEIESPGHTGGYSLFIDPVNETRAKVVNYSVVPSSSSGAVVRFLNESPGGASAATFCRWVNVASQQGSGRGGYTITFLSLVGNWEYTSESLPYGNSTAAMSCNVSSYAKGGLMDQAVSRERLPPGFDWRQTPFQHTSSRGPLYWTLIERYSQTRK